jgi:beta-lactamase regulating signal transducer with metallopeptidase domain
MTVVLDLAARALILLSLAWLGAWTLRRQSAAVRAGVWTSALAGLLLLPVASIAAPAWRVPVWSAAEAASPRPAVNDVAPATPAAAASTPAFGVARSQPISEVLETALVSEPPAGRFSWSTLMLIALGAMTVLLVSRVVVSHRRLARVVRSASPAGAEWSVMADEVGAALGLTRSVPVRITDAMNVPAVAGLWKPVLLLPAEAREWTSDVRRAVALHELAHVSRRDPLSQLIGQLSCAVYWCVPPVWLGARRASALRERASDDVVLAAGIRPSSYAENLIALARSAPMPVSPAALSMAQPSRMRERVEAILNPAVRRNRVTRLAMVLTSLAVVAATTVVGAVELTTVETVAPSANAAPANIESPKHARTLIDFSEAPVSAPAVPPSFQEPPDRLCGGAGLDKSSSSIHEDNGLRRWTVKLSGSGCTVDLRAEGKFEFTPDFTDISSLTSNGFFRVDVTDRGVRRQLEIESRNGTLTRTWRVDGRERPYDAEARAWFAGFLIELDRRTAIGVDIRLPLLVKQGGVDAVLKETALMPSDYARSRYYQNLPAAAMLGPQETIRVIEQAASLTKSDYYLAELVEAYGGSGVPADVRKALMQLINGIESDHYRANSIERLMGPGVPAAADVDVMMDLVARMKSDHYKAEVMTKVLRADNLGAAQQAAIASAAATVGSDYYATEVLKALTRKGLRDDVVRRAYFDAVAKIDSDHYQGEALGSFLSAPSLTERDLIDAVATTKAIGSDYNRSQALERIARHGAANDKVRAAVLDAAAGLSRHYAEQVRRAVGR